MKKAKGFLNWFRCSRSNCEEVSVKPKYLFDDCSEKESVNTTLQEEEEDE